VAEGALPAGDAAPGDPPPGRGLPPGASTFTIEGRAAPGLYFVGWIASLIGLGTLFVALMAGGSGSAIVVTLAGAAVLAVGLVAASGSQAIERRVRGVPYHGPSPFLVFAASLPLTILLVIVVVAPAAWLGLDASSPVAALISVAVTAVVYVGLVRLLVVGQGALSWRDMGVRPLDASAVRDLGSGAALALPIIVLTSVLAAILVQLVGTTPDSPLPPSSSAVGFVVNLVAAAIVAPIGEELFYRGFATSAWAVGMGARGALIRGALFFALVHVLTIGGASFGDAAGRALVAFAARVPVALALGWVFLRRRSIYASIGLHATFNGLLVILAELAFSAGS
jgi:membrane protease YdiL (CAAX protease family)